MRTTLSLKITNDGAFVEERIIIKRASSDKAIADRLAHANETFARLKNLKLPAGGLKVAGLGYVTDDDGGNVRHEVNFGGIAVTRTGLAVIHTHLAHADLEFGSLELFGEMGHK